MGIGPTRNQPSRKITGHPGRARGEEQTRVGSNNRSGTERPPRRGRFSPTASPAKERSPGRRCTPRTSRKPAGTATRLSHWTCWKIKNQSSATSARPDKSPADSHPQNAHDFVHGCSWRAGRPLRDRAGGGMRDPFRGGRAGARAIFFPSHAAIPAIPAPATRPRNIPPRMPSAIFSGLLGRTGLKPGTALSTISAAGGARPVFAVAVRDGVRQLRRFGGVVAEDADFDQAGVAHGAEVELAP